MIQPDKPPLTKTLFMGYEMITERLMIAEDAIYAKGIFVHALFQPGAVSLATRSDTSESRRHLLNRLPRGKRR